MKDISKLNELYGETVALTTPSGHNVVIRQQNGDDDDVVSSAIGAQDGTSINKFISGIVVDTDITPTGKLTLEDVLRLKVCDKYFIILASRIFSLGQYLRFTYKWEDLIAPIEYEEDISQYIWDYTKEFPKDAKNPNYFEGRIPPHIHGKELSREFVTRTGKKLRYDFMNGLAEKYMVTLDNSLVSKNQEYYARNMHQWVDNKWVKIESFKTFTPTDMVDIRKEVQENDPQVTLVTELEHPISHQKVNFLIVGTLDFFYPREI